jgi:hypothetical protein
MVRFFTSGLLAAALWLNGAAPLQAQRSGAEGPTAADGRRMYTVVVGAGETFFDNASALQNALHATLEARYNVRPNVGVGPYLTISRPLTDGEYFPMVRMAFSDTVYHLLVNQQVTMIEPGLAAFVRFPVGSFEVHGMGGAGLWVISLDPQRSWRPGIPGETKSRDHGAAIMLGAGVAYDFGATGGLRLSARNVMMRDFDREFLSNSDPFLPSELIPHPRQSIPAAQSSINNLRLEAGFHFSPRGGR